jgi:hypothetical protein
MTKRYLEFSYKEAQKAKMFSINSFRLQTFFPSSSLAF